MKCFKIKKIQVQKDKRFSQELSPKKTQEEIVEGHPKIHIQQANYMVCLVVDYRPHRRHPIWFDRCPL
jgi:hypothetical protein